MCVQNPARFCKILQCSGKLCKTYTDALLLALPAVLVHRVTPDSIWPINQNQKISFGLEIIALMQRFYRQLSYWKCWNHRNKNDIIILVLQPKIWEKTFQQ